MRAGCPAVSGSDKAFYVVDTIKFKIVIAHSRKIAFKSVGVDRPAGKVILTSRNSVLRPKQWQGNKSETVSVSDAMNQLTEFDCVGWEERMSS